MEEAEEREALLEEREVASVQMTGMWCQEM